MCSALCRAIQILLGNGFHHCFERETGTMNSGLNWCYRPLRAMKYWMHGSFTTHSGGGGSSRRHDKKDSACASWDREARLRSLPQYTITPCRLAHKLDTLIRPAECYGTSSRLAPWCILTKSIRGKRWIWTWSPSTGAIGCDSWG